MDNVSDMTNFHSRLFVHAGKAFASRSMRLPITDLPSDLPSVSPFECVVIHSPICFCIYLALLFSSVSVSSVCTYSQGYICTRVWRPEVNTFPITPYRVGWDTEPEAHNKTKWYNQWSQDPDSPTSCLSTGVTMSAQLLLGCWGSELSQVLTFPQQVLYGQLSPESETPFSKASSFSRDTRTELRVTCRIDKALPLCCLSSQGTVSLHACFQSALPPSEQRRARKSSSEGSCPRRRILPSVSVLSERWFKTSNLHQWKYPQTYKIKQEFTYYSEHTLLIRTLEISS